MHALAASALTQETGNVIPTLTEYPNETTRPLLPGATLRKHPNTPLADSNTSKPILHGATALCSVGNTAREHEQQAPTNQ